MHQIAISMVETFTDDTVVALASFLSPHDMLSLALSCKRFGVKNSTDKKRSVVREESSESSREVRQKIELISLIEVAARRVLPNNWTDEENSALPRRGDESWIGTYQEFLKLFHYPLQFDKLIGECVDYVDSSDKTTVCRKVGYIESGIAICNNIMRAGRHSVTFQVNHGSVQCGIMRPTTKDITCLRRCHPARDDLSMFSLKDYKTSHTDNSIDCCIMNTYSGDGVLRKRWKQWMPTEWTLIDDIDENATSCQRFDWDGMEATHDNKSFKIGLVLDLDEGTLDVYKDDRRLGTMMSWLYGEYCWVVSFSLATPGVSVSIDR